MTTQHTQPGPWPPCPTCGSTRRHCTRPSEHQAPEWHAARLAAYAALPEDKRAQLARIIDCPQVRVEPTPGSDPAHPRFAMWCQHCTTTYASPAKTDVQDKARQHRAAHRTGQIGAAR